MNLRLKELRAKHNMSQKELSRHLTMLDQSKLSMIEKGERKLSVDEAIEIANFFDVSVDYLVGNTDRTLKEEKRIVAMYKAITDLESKI